MVCRVIVLPVPAVPVSVVGDVDRAEATLADGMQAIRIQARLRLGAAPQAVTTDVLLYLPQSNRPVPLFLHLNFKGNQGEHPDPAIRMAAAWLPNDKRGEVVDNRATAASRAQDSRHWPAEKLLARGYGLGRDFWRLFRSLGRSLGVCGGVAGLGGLWRRHRSRCRLDVWR